MNRDERSEFHHLRFAVMAFAPGVKRRVNVFGIAVHLARTVAINPALRKNLPYVPLRDFAPVSLLRKLPKVLAVNNAFPEKNVALFKNGRRTTRMPHRPRRRNKLPVLAPEKKPRLKRGC